MAAAITGTPVAITWAAGADPAGQSITIPADATAVYLFWAFWVSVDGAGLSTATLNGAAPAETTQKTVAGSAPCTGCAAWYAPPTGTQTIDVAWTNAPAEGPVCVVVCVTGSTAGWRNAGTDSNTTTNAVSVSLTSASGDLVLKFDQLFSASVPALSSGWTSQQTTTNNSEAARLSSITASGAATVCDAEGENYSSIAAISIVPSDPPQAARPSSDVSAGTWTPSTGASLAGTIDETPFSDTDYDSATANGTFRVNLSAVSTPDTGTRTVRFRAGGSSAKKLIATLIEGSSTTVASTTIDPLPAAVTAQSFTVSGAIGNYADLDLSFQVADATTTPTPSVTFGAIGTGANGGASVAPTYPASITSGDLLVLTVTSGGATSPTPSTPSGWTSQGSYVTTDGTYGIDTGPRRVTVFTKPADGTETGTLSVTITGGDSCRGSIMRLSKGQASYVWDIAATGGNYSANGTAVSVTGGAIGFAPGDLVIVSNGQRVDTATQSAQALTASGITFGTRTNRASVAVTTGNDHRHVIDSIPVSTGTASVAPTWSYTASAACSAAIHILRIREVPPTEFARVTFAEFEVPAAAGGGTLATTNANDTVAGTGTTTVVGTGSRTNANDTSSAAGTTSVRGTLARTNAADTAAASGSTTVTGSLARTNANDTLAASGSVGAAVSGTLARTNANDTLSALGTTTVIGTVARANAPDTSSASGSPVVSGSMARTNANDSISASGSVGSAVTGTLARTNANDTVSASGTTTVTGSLARTNSSDTLSASGATTVTGSLARTNSNDSVSAAGSPIVSGVATRTNANDTMLASGSAGAATGTLASTNGDDTCAASGNAGIGSIAIGGGGMPYARRARLADRIPTDEEVRAERVRLGILPPDAPPDADAVASPQPPTKPTPKAPRAVISRIELDAKAIIAANESIRAAIEAARNDELSHLVWESVQQDEAAVVALIAELIC